MSIHMLFIAEGQIKKKNMTAKAVGKITFHWITLKCLGYLYLNDKN